MARFYKLPDDGQRESIWINIDTIVSMYYDKDADSTYIFSCDDPSEHFTVEGNVTSAILNLNNELTMRDKNFAIYFVNKFKIVFSSMIARLDSISKIVEKRWGRNERI